jgi:hypothetical protein
MHLPGAGVPTRGTKTALEFANAPARIVGWTGLERGRGVLVLSLEVVEPQALEQAISPD